MERKSILWRSFGVNYDGTRVSTLPAVRKQLRAEMRAYLQAETYRKPRIYLKKNPYHLGPIFTFYCKAKPIIEAFTLHLLGNGFRSSRKVSIDTTVSSVQSKMRWYRGKVCLARVERRLRTFLAEMLDRLSRKNVITVVGSEDYFAKTFTRGQGIEGRITAFNPYNDKIVWEPEITPF